MKKYLLLVNILIIIVAGFLVLNNSKTIQNMKSREQFLSDKEYTLKENITKCYTVEIGKFNIESTSNYNDSLHFSLKGRVEKHRTHQKLNIEIKKII